MKAAYESPVILVQAFVPNEYVAACGDSGTVYKFVCDAEGGSGVYQETNGTPGLQRIGEALIPDRPLALTYQHCGETHNAESTDAFVNGYVVVPFGSDETITNVIIWRGPNGNNVHCTTNLDMSTWETAKS